MENVNIHNYENAPYICVKMIVRKKFQECAKTLTLAHHRYLENRREITASYETGVTWTFSSQRFGD